jgi:sugar lactone lactonase YvrE
VVTTLAGSASKPGSGDGAGSAARFSFPQGIAVDNTGHVYVADSGNDTIRKITPDGVVSTLAGLGGNSGSADGTGSAALFTNPVGISVDAAGNVYVSEDYNHTLRKITPGGVVTTLAGKAGVLGNADGSGAEARFNSPARMTLDGAGNLFVADSGNNIIRMVTPDGAVTTWAGKPSAGTADGIGKEALFAHPSGLAVDDLGNVYVADYDNHTVRKIAPSGIVSTLAGEPREPGSADGKGNSARFDHPEAIAIDRAGNLYVTDTWNHTIRKITLDGVVTTLAGLAGSYGSADGAGSDARFFHPYGVAVDPAGNVFVTDGYNQTIRKITPTGMVTTLAGKVGKSGHLDGVGSDARFRSPDGLATDSDGNIYVADLGNHVIRKITPTGSVTTLAGLAGVPGSVDGQGSEARFSGPHALVVDQTGHIYVADRRNNAIRLITPDGFVSTLAGSAKDLRGSTDGTAGAARFFVPSAVAVDSAGNLYVADGGNNSIRKGTPAVITFGPARPRLRIELSGKNLVLSWSTSAAGFVLESSELLSPVIWTPVSPAPTVVGESYAATLPVSSGSKFYRLRKP